MGVTGRQRKKRAYEGALSAHDSMKLPPNSVYGLPPNAKAVSKKVG
jgi:hypothetical protein